MSLSVGASGSALINQLLASLYQNNNANTQSTPSNSDANATNTAPSNSLEGTGKPSFSDDVLTAFMQLQQSQEQQGEGDFLDPAKTRVDDTPSQPAPASQTPTITGGHNNMMRAIKPNLASNTAVASPANVAVASTVTDDTGDGSDVSAAGFQAASTASFRV